MHLIFADAKTEQVKKIGLVGSFENHSLYAISALKKIKII